MTLSMWDKKTLDKTRCHAMVSTYFGNFPRFSQCSNKHKVQRQYDGKLVRLCTTHDPIRAELLAVQREARRKSRDPWEKIKRVVKQRDAALLLLKKVQHCGINRDLRYEIKKLLDETA